MLQNHDEQHSLTACNMVILINACPPYVTVFRASFHPLLHVATVQNLAKVVYLQVSTNFGAFANMPVESHLHWYDLKIDSCMHNIT